jgi:adenine-specific DNA methylase
VHYSQLADFFHVWQRHILGNDGVRESETTRCALEVQHGDAETFAKRLEAVWRESHRVLKQNGLLIFTYHHSRPEGWTCVLKALTGAGFIVVAAHPVKAEMSVAAPKSQAKEPIDYDIIMVCRKRRSIQPRPAVSFEFILEEGTMAASAQVARLRACKRPMSRNDARIILMSQVIRHMSNQPATLIDAVASHEDELERRIDALLRWRPLENQQVGNGSKKVHGAALNDWL